MPAGMPSYSVLAVSGTPKFTSSLAALLTGPKYARTDTASDISAAKRACADYAYDFVIVNSPLPDDTGVRFAIDLSAAGQTVVLLTVRAEVYAEVTERVTPHGVFTLARPMSVAAVETALNWMAAARERIRKTERRTLTLEEKMEEIRVVNRAKWLLIEKEDMDEPAAHRYIEKQAMDRCITRRAVAEEILARYK
jgi:response regulator NasT